MATTQEKEQYVEMRQALALRLRQGDLPKGAYDALADLLRLIDPLKIKGEKSPATIKAIAAEELARWQRAWDAALYDERAYGDYPNKEQAFSEWSQDFWYKFPESHTYGQGHGANFDSEANLGEGMGAPGHYLFPKEVDSFEKLAGWVRGYYADALNTLKGI